MPIQFGVKRWAAIAPDLADLAPAMPFDENQIQRLLSQLAEPDLSQFPRMLRRRLGRSGRLAMSAIESLKNMNAGTASIFASRHGEVELTHSLLQGIAQQQSMSPMAFSMSVHNAVGGIYTIAQENTSPLNAIAASDGLILPVLFEAATQINAQQDILCVIYDAPIQDIYSVQHIGPEVGFALAFILTQDGDYPQLSLYQEVKSAASDNAVHDQVLSHEVLDDTSYSKELSEFLACVEMLSQHKSIYLNHANVTWRLAVA